MKCVFGVIAHVVLNQARTRENRTPHDPISTVPIAGGGNGEDEAVETFDESRFLDPRPQISPEHWTISRDEVRHLLPLIPRRASRMISLKVKEDGLTAKEIAAVLGMSEREVWNLVRLVRRQFRP